MRWIFELPEIAKNEILDFSGPTCVSYGYFIHYFICKCSFREISMIKMAILEQSKPISLILKIKNSKIINYIFIIHKKINKTSIQPILKSNSTSFMFNKKFCEMKGKKVIHLAWGNGGTVQIASWKCNFGIYLDIQAITTLL